MDSGQKFMEANKWNQRLFIILTSVMLLMLLVRDVYQLLNFLGNEEILVNSHFNIVIPISKGFILITDLIVIGFIAKYLVFIIILKI